MTGFGARFALLSLFLFTTSLVVSVRSVIPASEPVSSTCVLALVLRGGEARGTGVIIALAARLVEVVVVKALFALRLATLVLTVKKPSFSSYSDVEDSDSGEPSAAPDWGLGFFLWKRTRQTSVRVT